MPQLRSAVRRILGRPAETADVRPKRRYVEDALEGIERVRAAGHERPILLVMWMYDAENPFQALLTRHAEEAGIVTVGMDRLADLDDPIALPALAALRSSERVIVVLHLHWLARVLRGVADEAEGLERVSSFVAALDAFRMAGGQIIWTVHNVLPHDTPYPALDRALRKAVVARAELVHVLSAGTVEAAAPSYEIPDAKVLHLPHPAYLDVYPDDVSGADARKRYKLGADDVVYGFVGNIRPYKGVDDLLDAFESITGGPARTDRRRRRLLVAGLPSAHPEIAGLLTRMERNSDIVLDARRIPADELSIPLRASDVVVLPHRESLNSGALLLALSFGRPVVAAASAGVTETVAEDAAITFEAGDRGALIEALIAADRLMTPEAQEAALATARRFDPDEISRAFAKAVRERLA
ncbi:MAG TPA: glycosyltransferase [Candidatus Limnocylindrales bacterium]|nr:glycosyltransferase [Candidatus Limnocylindrales bacterium]